jgi:hypothetical protein
MCEPLPREREGQSLWRAQGAGMNMLKKILMLTHEFPPYPGGVGRYCWSLAAAAARPTRRTRRASSPRRQRSACRTF